MDEKYPQEGSAGIAPAESEGLRGVAPPDQHTPSTGDDRVDAAVAGLSRLPESPADEHVAVLEEVHGRLRDILGELDEGPERRDLAQGRP